MSDSDGDAFQSADEGEVGAKSADNSPSSSATAKKEQNPKASGQGKKKDRRRGKKGKKGDSSPRSDNTQELTTQLEQKKEVEAEDTTPQFSSADDVQSDDKIIVSSQPSEAPIESSDHSSEKEMSSLESKNTDAPPPTQSPSKPEDQDTEDSKSQTESTPLSVDQPKDDCQTSKGEVPDTEKEPIETLPKAQQPEIGRAFDRITDSTESQPSSGWGWGSGWGSSILSTATSSVSSFTSSIGEGIKTAVETVEHGLGIPDPEELAQIQSERLKEREAERAAENEKREDVPSQDMERSDSNDDIKEGTSKENMPPAEGVKKDENDAEDASNEKKQELDTHSAGGGGWLSSWGVAQLSTVVHKTAEVVGKVQDSSKTLVTGSLDVLESIGKKTYEAVAEGDRGVKQLNAGQKSNLSQLLREAAEEAENKAKQEEQFVEARKCHFGAQFDDYQGLVQLEALEMLANQCEAQVHSLLTGLPSDSLPKAKALLIAIKDAFTIEDLEDDEEEDQDFVGLMKESTGELGLNVTAEKLIAVETKALTWLQHEGDDGKNSASAIHQEAIQSLAQLTAASVGHFHRIGQLCLADSESQATIYKSRASTLASSTKYLGLEVGMLSAKFTHCLSSSATDKADTEIVNPLMTNVYLEATNSTSYIQDAFQLLLPVLQQAALQAQKREN